MNKRLTKSTDKILAGVCGGIADFFEIDPTLVRAGYAILTFFSVAFPGFLLYILLTFIMPSSDVD
ncbi:MAG: PspC domain-containing protein [Bacteroidales bacterium]|nr:PspC domain-containing protein [Candidatus Liminaster caballi]